MAERVPLAAMAGLQSIVQTPIVRTITRIAGVAIAVVLLVVVLPRVASWGEVADAFGDFSGVWLAPLLVVGAANLIAPATAHMASLPGLGIKRAVISDWTTTAITNLVPGGSAIAIAVTSAMYSRWGHGRAAIARSIVVTGVWDLLVKLTMPALAIVWLASERELDRGLLQAAMIGLALLVGAVVLGAILLGVRLPFLRAGWQERLDQLRADTVTLVRTNGISLTFWTLAGHLNLALLLFVCVRGLGVESDELSAAGILAAFAFGRLITAIPITPGGIGVMELGLTAALLASGTPPEAQTVAAVLLFRFFSLVTPIPLGIAGWAWWSGVSGKTVDEPAAEPVA